jgi:four helix bundle protein
MHIAMGSAAELDYQLLLARDLELFGLTEYHRMADELTEIRRMLNAFNQKLIANH